MRYKMKNETLTAEIESFGAELKSIKSNATGVEYIIKERHRSCFRLSEA